MTLRLLCAMAIVLITVASARAVGDDLSPPVVRLATHESPPYSGAAVEGDGLLGEIVRRAFERAGYRTEIEVLPWLRALELSRGGRYDGLFGAWYREERGSYFAYSAPLIANVMIFVGHRDGVRSFSGNYDDLAGYRIGYIRGYAVPADLVQRGDAVTLDAVTDNLQNLRKLEHHRLDLVIIDRRLFSYLLEHEFHESAEQFVPLDHVVSYDMNYLVFPKALPGYRALRQAFNRGLADLEAEGVIRAILGETVHEERRRKIEASHFIADP